MNIQTPNLPASVQEVRVTSVRILNSRLFALRTERPQSFRFNSGEFVMLGMRIGQKLVMRAYSIVSPVWHDELEFYSIIASDGTLTPKLKDVQVGDCILLGRKPTGTLTLGCLKPAENIFFLSTGTGIAPFLCLMRDPELYEHYSNVIISHTCRFEDDLMYSKEVIGQFIDDEEIGEMAHGKLTYFGSYTERKPGSRPRITDLIRSGEFFRQINREHFNPERDRVMICGSLPMINDLSKLLTEYGFEEGSHNKPGSYTIEKAFAS